MVPETLDAWDDNTLTELMSIGRVESDRHDFKRTLPSTKALTKTCCAFTNTFGGFVVVGVAENELKKGYTVSGIERTNEFAHQFGQRLQADPTIAFSEPKWLMMDENERGVAVVHVPKSISRPHLPLAQENRTFWKRTNKGNVQMTYSEIRSEFLQYENRWSRVNLLLVELITIKEQLDDMMWRSKSPHSYAIVRIKDDVISQLVADVFPLLRGNEQILRLFTDVRYRINQLNSFIDIFIARSTSDISTELIMEHNGVMYKSIDELNPRLDLFITGISHPSAR